MFNLQYQNKEHDCYLSKAQFMIAFKQVTNIKSALLEQLFEMFNEEFSVGDREKYVDVSYLNEKLFSAQEKLENAKIYHILGRVKNCFNLR